MSGWRQARLTRAVATRLPPRARELGKDLLVRRPRARWGNLRRDEPIGLRAGWDRGTPVDRVFIERFLARHAGDVRGRVLEVRDPRYTRLFGGQDVTESIILDVDPGNRAATLVADLARPGSLPQAAFDCVIVTQVLQLVADPRAGLANVAASLAPGALALVTVPALQPFDVRGREGEDRWRWSLVGFRQLLAQACPALDVEVEARGSLAAAIALFHGLAAEELEPAELERDDLRYPVVVCAALRNRS